MLATCQSPKFACHPLSIFLFIWLDFMASNVLHWPENPAEQFVKSHPSVAHVRITGQ